MRFKIVRLIIVLLFVALAADLVYVQLVRGRYFYNLSANNRIRVVALEGQRGRVFDRNGIVLAGNKVSYNVLVVPQDVKDVPVVFDYLSGVLGIEPAELVESYLKKRDAVFAPVVVAENIAKSQAMVLEENRFRFPGLLVQEGFGRYYPFRELFAHLLGYVGLINRGEMERLKEYGYSSQSIVGKSGIEEFYDAQLRGGAGGLQIEVNSRGEQVRLLGIKDPVRGEDIALTIDHTVQAAAAEVLGAQPGALIVMDTESGEILGMVSAPSFDPNIFVGERNARQARRMIQDSRAPLLNRAISGLYPPGSIFKVAMAVGALDSGVITPGTAFFCPGHYTLADTIFHCAHVHHQENLTEALGHSCNVYFYNLGMKLHSDTIRRYSRQLGLGEKTGIDLPYEAKGLVPSKSFGKTVQGRRWYQGDNLNLSIGQGDTLATPLQLVNMMARVALNGAQVKPHVIKAVGGQSMEGHFVRRRMALDPAVFADVKNGLRAAVSLNDGTALSLDIEGLSVAGKTGTAQTSQEHDPHSWFVGYNQNGRRKIVFCVFLEYGGSSANAVSVSRELLMRLKLEEVI